MGALPRFLRRPTTPAEARAILTQRFARRESDFLAMARATLSEPTSPYRRLFAAAGCSTDDLDRLVRREGVDGALHALARAGVYVTLDEFKGRRPIVRGSLTFSAEPAAFRNPRSAAHIPLASGGSRGATTPVLYDFAFMREIGVGTCVILDELDGLGWTRAFWDVPGSGVLARMLDLAGLGIRPERWFSYVDPETRDLHPRYRWSVRALRTAGAIAGRRFPRPEYVPPDDPLPIARWMASVLASGGTPHLLTYASSAVRLCGAAAAAGLDLSGARIWVGGEPLTPARLRTIRSSGASAWARYAAVESSVMAAGCLNPEAADDLHLYHDFVAMIQAGVLGTLPPGALLVSALRPAAPFALINVSLGDQAALTQRSCGCPLERVGWTTHLHTIRSYEKLTTGGMTFLDTRVVDVLEEDLPARFGGGPTDYQLVEDESPDGHPRVRLYVHPRVGPLDHEAVASAFLEALGRGRGAERVMELMWREASLVQVERGIPERTGSGKVQHLHVRGDGSRSPSGASPPAPP